MFKQCLTSSNTKNIQVPASALNQIEPKYHSQNQVNFDVGCT